MTDLDGIVANERPSTASRHSAITEAVNRARFTVVALNSGWMVYHPEADVGGVDLVIIDLANERDVRKVQLKSIAGDNYDCRFSRRL